MNCRLSGAALLVTAAFGLLSGCDKPAPPAGGGGGAPGGAAAATGDSVPGGLFVAQAPADAKDVLALKQSAKEGDTVVVQGRVGGSRAPFVEGRAMFTIADLGLPTCADNPADPCKTPWDYCCEPADKKVLNTLTVRVTGPSGEVLHSELKGASGLEPMAKVVVAGRISKKQDDKVLVIDAEEIHVVK